MPNMTKRGFKMNDIVLLDDLSKNTELFNKIYSTDNTSQKEFLQNKDSEFVIVDMYRNYENIGDIVRIKLNNSTRSFTMWVSENAIRSIDSPNLPDWF